MTEQPMTEQQLKDKYDVENCTYLQRLPEALEKGVIVDDTIFQNMEEAATLLSKSKYALLHNKPWSDIIGSNACAAVFDPLTKYSLVMDGSLGQMLGCQLYTDGFMAPHLKDKSPETMGKVIFVPRDTE
jgi:hypothetical protein